MVTKAPLLSRIQSASTLPERKQTRVPSFDDVSKPPKAAWPKRASRMGKTGKPASGLRPALFTGELVCLKHLCSAPSDPRERGTDGRSRRSEKVFAKCS